MSLQNTPPTRSILVRIIDYPSRDVSSGTHTSQPLDRALLQSILVPAGRLAAPFRILPAGTRDTSTGAVYSPSGHLGDYRSRYEMVLILVGGTVCRGRGCHGRVLWFRIRLRCWGNGGMAEWRRPRSEGLTMGVTRNHKRRYIPKSRNVTRRCILHDNPIVTFRLTPSHRPPTLHCPQQLILLPPFPNPTEFLTS